ncbi:response regulator [Candidatus Peregrinibacteria bacterium]|nr:response regulator [Candidatus Peregrinibacteria bacterium]
MRVLIVEDKEQASSHLKKMLEAKLMAVDICADKQEGIFHASCNSYDIIILDLIPSELSGFEVCKELRDKEINSPILILSAKSSISDKVKCLDIGADDYLTKPYDNHELLARINALSRRKHQSLNRIVKIKDLEIDLGKWKVKRSGKTINLSPREFRLLEYLVVNRGTVVNRYEIMENVWGSGERFFSNVVDVHINHLRKKIDEDSDEKILKTIRGCGYIVN